MVVLNEVTFRSEQALRFLGEIDPSTHVDAENFSSLHWSYVPVPISFYIIMRQFHHHGIDGRLRTAVEQAIAVRIHEHRSADRRGHRAYRKITLYGPMSLQARTQDARQNVCSIPASDFPTR